MYCSQCGREAKPGARFCAGCGAPIRTVRRAAALGSRDDDVPTTDASGEQAQPSLAAQARTPPRAEAHPAAAGRPSVAPLPLRSGAAKKSTNSLSWIGLSFVGIALVAAIGAYLYMPGLPKGMVTSIASPPSVENRARQVPLYAPAPPMPRADSQEMDAGQVMALAEAKVLEVKRSAAQSRPPVRGDRKLARAANGRGLAALQSGRIPDAVRGFAEAHRADPADVEVLNNLGYAHLMQGDYDSARPYMLSALALTPERSAAWANLGQIQAMKGETQDAVASFINTYRFSQNRSKTHQFLLSLMEKNGDPGLRQALTQATRIAGQYFLTTTP